MVEVMVEALQAGSLGMREGGAISGRRSWRHRAEHAERELRRTTGALRLSQAVHRVLRQSSDQTALPVQVCAALVEAGCLAAAWLVPGQPISLSGAAGTEVNAARLEYWFRSWDGVETELVAAAVPLGGLFAAAGAGRARHLLLPLREGGISLARSPWCSMKTPARRKRRWWSRPWPALLGSWRPCGPLPDARRPGASCTRSSSRG